MKRVTFASNRDGNSEIYVMNADGSNPINLTKSGMKIFQPGHRNEPQHHLLLQFL